MYSNLTVTVGTTAWTSEHATSESINIMQHMMGWLDRNRQGRWVGGSGIVEISDTFYRRSRKA